MRIGERIYFENKAERKRFIELVDKMESERTIIDDDLFEYEMCNALAKEFALSPIEAGDYYRIYKDYIKKEK